MACIIGRTIESVLSFLGVIMEFLVIYEKPGSSRHMIEDLQANFMNCATYFQIVKECIKVVYREKHVCLTNVSTKKSIHIYTLEA